MEKAKKIGIGVGIGIGVIAFFFLAVIGQYYDDARMARLDSWYYYDEDRLTIAVILTNQNADYTTANGHLELIIKKGTSTVYSNGYDFTKNDFLSWQPLFGGGKITGYPINIREYFSSGDYDVYVDMETKGGHYWEDLHDSFFSLE